MTVWEILDRDTQRYRPLPRKVGSAREASGSSPTGASAAASSLAHVLVRLGHPHLAAYDGGLLARCADRRLPLELGA